MSMYETEAEIIENLRRENKCLVDLLADSAAQIEYLNNRFKSTGTSEAILTRLQIKLKEYRGF